MAMSCSSSFSFVNVATASRQRTSSAAAHGEGLQGLSMPRISTSLLKTAGATAAARLSTLLDTPLRSAEEGCVFAERRRRRRAAGAAVVRAASIGVVQKVSATGGYFNVAVKLRAGSDVVEWYKTPGQYVDILPVESAHERGSSFFVASPPVKIFPGALMPDLEFLIEDVPNTVANEIINSKPGDRVVITPNKCHPSSDGFHLSAIEAAQSVLMFASGYGLGPFRSLIEKRFQANEKKFASLYPMYPSLEEEPYVERHAAWEKTGVKIHRGKEPIFIPGDIDWTQTVILLFASTEEQEKLEKWFEHKGVPAENIQTLFDGIPTSDNAYRNKVTRRLNNYPKFLHSRPKNAPIELNI